MSLLTVCFPRAVHTVACVSMHQCQDASLRRCIRFRVPQDPGPSEPLSSGHEVRVTPFHFPECSTLLQPERIRKFKLDFFKFSAAAPIARRKMPSLVEVQQGLKSAGQAHVLQFWPELSEEERTVFLLELAQLDLQGLEEHCETAAKAAASPPASLDQHLEPVPPECIGSVRTSDRESLTEWENEGERSM